MKSPAVRDYLAANRTMHQGMDITYTGDTDLDFVVGMIPHHQGAVDMTKVVLQYGHDPVIGDLAKRIATWQEAEIGMMKRWLNQRQGIVLSHSNEAIEAYKKAMDTMHTGMDIHFTGDADLDFARGMIPHHQGAIDMAEILLKYGNNEEIRFFARDVIRAQQQEIDLMQKWLEKQGKS